MNDRIAEKRLRTGEKERRQREDPLGNRGIDQAVGDERAFNKDHDHGGKRSDVRIGVSAFEKKVCKQHRPMAGLIARMRESLEDIARAWTTAKEAILDIARELNEHNLCETALISRKIKILLKKQIREGKVTAKWIEEVLPPEYKRKYEKSEQSSLSARELGKSAVALQHVSNAREVEPNQEERVNYLEQRRSPGNTGGTLGTQENPVGQTPETMAERTGEESLDENSDNNEGYFSALAEFSGTAVPISGGLASFVISKADWQNILVRALEECNSVVRMYFSVKTGALRRVVPDTESTGVR
jgi:hypothetical protein